MTNILKCAVVDCRSVDEKRYRDILPNLSDERRRLAESFRFQSDKVMSAVAGLCMERLAMSLGTNVMKSEDGKPVFERDDMHLSVSHSGGFVAMAWSDDPVGVDIQEHRPMGDIAKMVLSDVERQHGPFDDRTLLSIWTAKESYVKMTGEGMRRDFRDITVYDDGRFRMDGATFHSSEPVNGYKLCICVGSSGEGAPIPEISIFQNPEF